MVHHIERLINIWLTFSDAKFDCLSEVVTTVSSQCEDTSFLLQSTNL